jgi:hypothetical protein
MGQLFSPNEHVIGSKSNGANSLIFRSFRRLNLLYKLTIVATAERGRTECPSPFPPFFATVNASQKRFQPWSWFN